MMIERRVIDRIRNGLRRQAAVALIGPRQVGKTTLARAIAENRGGLYLDLESPRDRAKLTDPEHFLSRYTDRLVILDEIHHAGFYRTSAGAEIDLLLKLPGRTKPWAVEIKYGLSPKPSRGFHQAVEDLEAGKAFVVYSGDERFPLSKTTEAIGLRELAALLSK